MSDFVIPNENLSPPSPAGYGAASAAIDEATKAVLDPIAKAGQYLHKVAQDAAFVNMQADLLHAKEGANAKAIDLVQQGPGKGFDFITSEGIDDNGQPAPMRTIKLNPDFQTYLDQQQQALADKYKAFPDVAKYAMESFTATAVEAHKAAYQEATKDALAEGRAGVARARQYAIDDAIKTGKTTLLDAFGDNPTHKAFEGDAEFANNQDKAYAAASLGMFSKSLLDSVQNQGKDAAIAQLAQQTGIDENDRNQLKGQIEAVDAGEQAQWNQKVIDGAVKAHDEGGMIYSQALDQLVSQVPGFRQDATMKAATSYLDAKDKINNTVMRNSVDKYNQDGASWEDTLKWFSAKEQNFAANGDYQQEYAYIQARIKDEKEPPKGPLANRVPPDLMLLDSQPSSEKIDKGAVFRQAFKSGKIDGEELDYLLRNRKDDDPTLHDAMGIIHTWASPNPVTGATLIPPEQGVAANMMLNDWYRKRAAQGKTPDLQEIYGAVDHIKGVFTDKLLNQEVGQLFSTKGVLNQVLFGSQDRGAMNDLQGKIQRGETAEMSQTEGFQPTMKRYQDFLQKDLADAVKGAKVTSVKAPEKENGQTYLHTQGGGVYTYMLDANGKGVWKGTTEDAAKKFPDPASWPVVAKR